MKEECIFVQVFCVWKLFLLYSRILLSLFASPSVCLCLCLTLFLSACLCFCLLASIPVLVSFPVPVSTSASVFVCLGVSFPLTLLLLLPLPLYSSLSLSCSPSLFLFPTFPLSPYSTFSMQFFTGAAEYELCSWHYSVWPDSHTSSWSVWLGIWQRRCSPENCRSVCCIPSNIPSG